jgi:hypothetical protein
MLKTHQKFFEAASRYLQVLRVGRADFFFLQGVWECVLVSLALFFFLACVSQSCLCCLFFCFGRAGCALLCPLIAHTRITHTH